MSAPKMMLQEIKKKLLCYIAESYEGVTEQGGNNHGQFVEMFQHQVNPHPYGEPWCMAFVQYCLAKTDETFKAIYGPSTGHSLLLSERCLDVLEKSPKECVIAAPEVGSIVVWEHGDTGNGHTGIIIGLNGDSMATIEGNTGPDNKTVAREGDGVYRKIRNISGQGDMKVKGFLKPWP